MRLPFDLFPLIPSPRRSFQPPCPRFFSPPPHSFRHSISFVKSFAHRGSPRLRKVADICREPSAKCTAFTILHFPCNSGNFLYSPVIQTRAWSRDLQSFTYYRAIVFAVPFRSVSSSLPTGKQRLSVSFSKLSADSSALRRDLRDPEWTTARVLAEFRRSSAVLIFVARSL